MEARPFQKEGEDLSEYGGRLTESGPLLRSAPGAQGCVCVPYPDVPPHFLLQGLQELEGEGLGLRHVSTGHSRGGPGSGSSRGEAHALNVFPGLPHLRTEWAPQHPTPPHPSPLPWESCLRSEELSRFFIQDLRGQTSQEKRPL